jgi:hypothetical protein
MSPKNFHEVPHFVTTVTTMNDKLVTLFRDLAHAYGEDEPYKSLAFTRVADALTTAPFEIKKGKDILNLKGCGQSSAEIVDEFMETGTCARLDEINEDMDFDDECEYIENKRLRELDLLKIPRTVEDAKAFIILKRGCPSLKREAKKVLKSIDEVLKVYIAEELRDYLPHKDSYDDRCDYCNLVLDETDAEECACSRLHACNFLESIGCRPPNF